MPFNLFRKKKQPDQEKTAVPPQKESEQEALATQPQKETTPEPEAPKQETIEEPAVIATTVPEEHSEEEEKTIKGKTTFREVMDWGVSQEDIEIVIVDSVQTIYSKDIEGPVAGIGQLKEVTKKIINFAKQSKICVLLITCPNKALPNGSIIRIIEKFSRVFYFKDIEIVSQNINQFL